MTDPTAAAERLRRSKQEIRGPFRVYGGAWGAKIDADRRIVVDAYLAEHAADDAELITEEWVRSHFAERLPRVTAVRVYSATKDPIGISCDVMFWEHGAISVCISNFRLPHITTRGQLRLLLRALRQEPQP